MISYAQNFEDVLLNRVFQQQESGFYIDVGAMDPEEGSVTKSFYDRGWRGINIEPDRRFHLKLCAERVRDTNLNIAVGDLPGSHTFFAFEDQGISTFDESFRDYFLDKGRPFCETVCDVTTLAEICRAHVNGQIDFLKIDAEGWEGPVLRGADWVNYRPLVLLIECTAPYSHTPLWGDWEPYLLGRCGYLFVYFDGLNRYYVREENRELSSHFVYPVNVLDGFQMSSTVRAENRAADLQVQMQTLSEERRILREENSKLRTDAHALRDQLKRAERELLEARLWIGRLAEEAAAAKLIADRRPWTREAI